MQYKEHAGIFDCDEYTVRSRERERERAILEGSGLVRPGFGQTRVAPFEPQRVRSRTNKTHGIGAAVDPLF